MRPVGADGRGYAYNSASALPHFETRRHAVFFVLPNPAFVWCVLLPIEPERGPLSRVYSVWSLQRQAIDALCTRCWPRGIFAVLDCGWPKRWAIDPAFTESFAMRMFALSAALVLCGPRLPGPRSALLRRRVQRFTSGAACGVVQGTRLSIASTVPFPHSWRFARTVTGATERARAARIPGGIRVGLGGQPGTATSTGMTFETRPQLA